jgi:hypothetical protein
VHSSRAVVATAIAYAVVVVARRLSRRDRNRSLVASRGRRRACRVTVAHPTPASFQPTPDDLNYSVKHPTLAAKGAVDGVLLSGSAIDDNDHLSRRDQGLEFLNVTSRVKTAVSTVGNADTWVINNNSTSVIDTHLLVVLTNLAPGVTVDATSKTTGTALPGGTSSGERAGEPYYRIFLPDGVLNPGQSISLTVIRTGGSSSSYTLKPVRSGQAVTVKLHAPASRTRTSKAGARSRT